VSRFDGIMAQVRRPVLLDEVGRTVTYTPVTGDPVELTAIVGPVEVSEDDEFEGRTSRSARSVMISTDPDAEGGGVASPGMEAKLTIDSVAWAIEAIEALTGSMARLRVVRIESMERTREGYRGRR